MEGPVPQGQRQQRRTAEERRGEVAGAVPVTETRAPPSSERRSWIGRPVRRNEDGRFLTGRGEYVDDVVLPGMLHAAMLRSPHAHARITRLDCSRALAMPGVHGVLTGDDVVRAMEPEKGSTYPRGGSWYYMATDRGRFSRETV